ncbi:D-fructose-6-phosphate amidotransferase [Bacillus sp. NRRL B-14911]|nr:D-fructose-6-phosphate amidotransferase [Bacillus sp. NRRL B-14911]
MEGKICIEERFGASMHIFLYGAPKLHGKMCIFYDIS